MHSALQQADRPVTHPRSRIGFAVYTVLLVAASFLSLYISASIFLSVAVTSLLNVIGVAAAYGLWLLPRKGLRITAMVILGAIVVLEYSLGFDAFAFCLLTIVGALALMRFQATWLYFATGAVALLTGNSGITMSRNENLVPRLFTEAVPAIDLHAPSMLASVLMTLAAMVLLSVGTWRVAQRLDVLAVALIVAAGANMAAAYLGFVSPVVTMLLGQAFPDIYEFDPESASMTGSMLPMLTMRAKDIIIGILTPIGMIIIGIVRLVRQRNAPRRGRLHLDTSPIVTALTAVALGVPTVVMLAFVFVDIYNPVHLVMPLLIDLGAFVLWVIAVIAWWLHTSPARAQYAPCNALTRADLIVTLVLASTPMIIAALDVAFAFIP